MEHYRPRAIHLLERWRPGGWRIKVYGIGASGSMPPSALVEAGKGAASDTLSGVASKTEHHGVGFLGVHAGRGADVVFLDWWARENELHHRLWIAEPGRPDSLRSRSPDEFIACVWDLEVVCFERNAWIRSILSHPAEPRWEEYLSTALEGSDRAR